MRLGKWGTGKMLFIDVSTRIEGGGADLDGKMVTISQQLGNTDPDNDRLPLDETGAPIYDFKTIATIAHAALGYGNNDKAEDKRFEQQESDFMSSLSFDDETLELPGAGWERLKDCSFKATVVRNADRKDPNKIYARFNYISPVNG